MRRLRNYTRTRDRNTAAMFLDGELHDSIDQIIVVALEGLDGLASGAVGLVHDELDVLGVDTSLIDGLVVSSGGAGGGLAGRLAVEDGLLGALLGDTLSGLLGVEGSLLGSEILNLGLAEDDVGVGAGGLEHVRPGDDEHDVLGLLHGDADDTRDGLHAKLEDGLSGLLLATGGALVLQNSVIYQALTRDSKQMKKLHADLHHRQPRRSWAGWSPAHRRSPTKSTRDHRFRQQIFFQRSATTPINLHQTQAARPWDLPH